MKCFNCGKFIKEGEGYKNKYKGAPKWIKKMVENEYLCSAECYLGFIN